jgi:hypothetical protein
MRNTCLCAILLAFSISACKSGSIDTAATKTKLTDNYLKEISVTKIDTLDQVGEPWDSDSSGPDMSVSLFKGVSPEALYSTFTRTNVKKQDFPVTWQAPDIKLNNSQWRLSIYDDDEGYKQEMAQFAFNGNTDDTAIVLSNPKGFEVRLKIEKRAP